MIEETPSSTNGLRRWCHRARLGLAGVIGLMLALVLAASLPAQPAADAESRKLLKADRVFDGERWLEPGTLVYVQGSKIHSVGTSVDPEGDRAEVIDLAGLALLPGLIEAHSHVLLHPYDETSWNDQVLKESEALRVARASVHLERTLQAGFTTLRDLGTEGAGYADLGLKQAVNRGILPGPRLLIASKAIVATGSYGPKGFAPHVPVPLGAEPADASELPRVVRDQIGHGADWIKVYADYRWGPAGEAMPSFSLEELELIVETARSSGRPTVAHASTAEGMRRAILAGVRTIEHGDGATDEVFRLMVQHDVALCPTIAAGDAISQYGGWRKSEEPEPPRVQRKRQSVRRAIELGVTLCNGSDVGVFPHGDNVREIELLVDYGLSALEALRSATSVNADALGLADVVGRLKPGLEADIIAVEGDPGQDVSRLRAVRMVMQSGRIVRANRD